MTHHALIAQRGAEAMAEIHRMANEARAELKFMAAFWNRSLGQQRRFARLKGKK